MSYYGYSSVDTEHFRVSPDLLNLCLTCEACASHGWCEWSMNVQKEDFQQWLSRERVFSCPRCRGTDRLVCTRTWPVDGQGHPIDERHPLYPLTSVGKKQRVRASSDGTQAYPKAATELKLTPEHELYLIALVQDMQNDPHLARAVALVGRYAEVGQGRSTSRWDYLPQGDWNLYELMNRTVVLEDVPGMYAFISRHDRSHRPAIRRGSGPEPMNEETARNGLTLVASAGNGRAYRFKQTITTYFSTEIARDAYEEQSRSTGLYYFTGGQTNHFALTPRLTVIVAETDDVNLNDAEGVRQHAP